MSEPDASYFDLQVNGYAGVDFNGDNLSADMLEIACARLHRDQVGGILATVITDHIETMVDRIRRLIDARRPSAQARSMIAGLHLEGPFLNRRAGYRGAHPEDAIAPASIDAMARLFDACDGLCRLVTLAPEADPQSKTIEWLRQRGVTVAAGHTDASLEQLDRAIDAGLSIFTHVGNACPMELPRHDNIIQRALSRSERLWLTFIADGAHVPFFALDNFIRRAGLERTIVVTDAISAAGMAPGRHRMGRWDLLLGADMVARAPDGSHLVGSAITMPKSHENLRNHLNWSDADCQRALAINPRAALTEPPP